MLILEAIQASLAAIIVILQAWLMLAVCERLKSTYARLLAVITYVLVGSGTMVLLITACKY